MLPNLGWPTATVQLLQVTLPLRFPRTEWSERQPDLSRARPTPRVMANPRASCVVIGGAVVSCEMPISLHLHCASKWSRRLRQQPATSLKSKICTPSWSSYTSSALLCPRGGVDHLLSRCSRASRTMLDEDIGGGRYQVDARRSTFRDGPENHGSPGSQGERRAHTDPDYRGDQRGVESIPVSRNVEAIQLEGLERGPGIRAKH